MDIFFLVIALISAIVFFIGVKKKKDGTIISSLELKSYKKVKNERIIVTNKLQAAKKN